MRRQREEDPRRPVATFERYEATRNALHEMATAAEDELTRLFWQQIEFALMLAEATGRRVGSIRALRWEDFNWERSTITWRAEADKKRRESVVPMSVKLAAEVRTFQRLLVGLGGLCFPSDRDASLPMGREIFDKARRYAVRKAKLKPRAGGLWHPYRRSWATARKHLPIADVAAAGGWRDIDTLIRCYQQPTNDVLIAVMSEERKVREVSGIARNG
jgi:integrase